MRFKTIIQFVLLAGGCFSAVDSVRAQGTLFTYQGRLSSGGSVANGVYDLRFALYNALTNGSTAGPVLTNTATSISNGLFIVNLNFGTGVFNGTPYWLEIAARSNGVATTFTPLSPRQSLTVTPYALYATNAGAALTAASADTATSSTTAGAATNFSGSLAGEVTGTQSNTVVSKVGGVVASNIVAGATAANAATSTNTPNTIVRRDASGNFSAGIITANFAGDGAGLTNLNTAGGAATNFSGSLAGEVTGTQSNTVVTKVGGVAASNIVAGAAAANAATSTNTLNTIVRRDASGNFSAGTITAAFAGNGAGLTNLNAGGIVATNFGGSLAGEVTGTQNNTVVTKVGGVAASNIAAGAAAANAATSTNTPNTIVRRDASGNFSAGMITATFAGNGAGLTNLSTGGGAATNFSGSLAGEVTGTQSNTVVSKVAGVIASNIANGAAAANAATNNNAPNSIVRRDASGNFSAGTISATFVGNGAGLTNLNTGGGGASLPPTGMALIPAGTFNMGDALDGTSDSIPTTNTTISAFYLDVNPVSFSQWLSVYYWATANGYSLAQGAGKAPNNPVQTLDWFDAIKWCNARSEQAGKTPVYYTDAGFTAVYRTGEVAPFANWSANGYRLPTEAEFERAARAGLNGLRFPWGNLMSENLANYKAPSSSYSYDLGPVGYNSIGSVGGTTPATSPVGSFAPNGYGLYDMSGNILEWCWDWYDVYTGGTDPRGPASGSDRVMRGGYWNGDARAARCCHRTHNPPFVGSTSVGLRCVMGH